MFTQYSDQSAYDNVCACAYAHRPGLPAPTSLARSCFDHEFNRATCSDQRAELKMEGARQARPPTVVPLTTDLIQKILHQQQLQKGAALFAANKATQDSVGVTASQCDSVPQQQGATAINLTEMGKHHHQVQGSRAAISVQVLNNNTPRQTASQPPKYTYKVKIVNPGKKCVVIVRYLHNFTDKFESVNGLRVRLMDEFQQHVPATATFDVGYFERKQQSKNLVSNF